MARALSFFKNPKWAYHEVVGSRGDIGFLGSFTPVNPGFSKKSADEGSAILCMPLEEIGK